jgi:hypothetical protein
MSNNRFICPICGAPKRHSRLTGYGCHHMEHDARCADIETRWLYYTGTVDQFVATFPEGEQDTVRRVLAADAWDMD